MALFLFRFWPVLIPTLLYFFWRISVQKLAHKKGEPMPQFSDAHLYWLAIITLFLAGICFVAIGFTMEGQKGNYQPSHMENNILVPSRVLP